jgi:hypothetical protein
MEKAEKIILFSCLPVRDSEKVHLGRVERNAEVAA